MLTFGFLAFVLLEQADNNTCIKQDMKHEESVGEGERIESLLLTWKTPLFRHD